ncbi:MAG: MerR family transcriptional regulator [Candidatus Omnitrophota bacterium]
MINYLKTKRCFIKDLERKLGINRKTYFYWEKTGKVPKAKRTPMGNYRYWTEEDIKKLRKIIEG